MSEHRHIDTRWNFSREGVRVYCRDCKKWRTTFETGYQPEDGAILADWPGPPPGSFQAQMDDLRRRLRELGWAIVDAARIPDLVAWLDLVILKWELRRQTRRLGIKFKDLRVSDVQEFLDEIGITEEQFKSIRKDIRPETRLGQAGGRNTKC